MNKAKWYVIAGVAAMVVCVVLLLAGRGLSLVNLPGLILVLGGTYLASVIAHGNRSVLELLRRIPQLLRDPPESEVDDEKPFLRAANLYRRGDIRAAERVSQGLSDPFLRDGARLALDPQSGDELVRMLQWRIRLQKETDGAEIRILRTMATFAPAFGMLGTLLGLVSLLDDLSAAGLEQIGVSMGFALMSTLYGLLAANLVFRPLALKLEGRSRRRTHRMGFWLEALVMLYERRHPLLIGEYLESGSPTAPEVEAEPTMADVTPLALGRT